jgi:hypothetical protein
MMAFAFFSWFSFARTREFCVNRSESFVKLLLTAKFCTFSSLSRIQKPSHKIIGNAAHGIRYLGRQLVTEVKTDEVPFSNIHAVIIEGSDLKPDAEF